MASQLAGYDLQQTRHDIRCEWQRIDACKFKLDRLGEQCFGNQNVSAGAANLKIGSYSFAASSAEGVNVNNVGILLGGTVNSGLASQVFQNLKLMINGSQFGGVYGSLQQGGTYTFSGTPFSLRRVLR